MTLAALVRFFRKNFHDEIQRLSSSNPSETHLPITANRTATDHFPRAPTIVTNTYDGGSSVYHKRSGSTAARPSFSTSPAKRGHVAAPSVTLSIPISLSNSLRERIASPTEQYRSPLSQTATNGQHLTPLQRNIAHLNKYGLSAPGTNGYNGSAHPPPASPETTSNGSLINVGIGTPGKTHSIRDTSSIFSNRTKERLSRLGSLGWMKREA